MKKAAVILLALVIALSAVACVSTGGGNNSSLTVSNSSVSPSDNTDTSSDFSSSEPPSSITDSSKPDSSVAGPSSSHTGSSDKDEIISQPIPQPEPQPEPSIHEEHYCYSKLTDRQKEYYEVMHDAVNELQPSWIVLGEASRTYKTDVAVVRNALANDHPDIFWLPSYYATAIATSSAGTSTVMVYFSVSSDSNPSYLMTISERDRKAAELEKAVKEITDKVTATDPYEIELQLHDMLCEAVEYSDRTDDPQVYTAYGALVNKSAVCEGYSRAMQLLLSRFGIPCVTVTGTALSSGEGHMWNAVKLHGEWYHLDATWNDSTIGAVSHEYFNITDSLISLDHTFNKNYYEFEEGELDNGTLSFNTFRPICKGTEYNYFNRSGFVFFADGITALTGYITRVEDTAVEVKFSDTAFRDRFNADSDRFVQRINEQLRQDYPDCGFYIGAYSVSASVLRLYKTEQVTVDSSQVIVNSGQ